MKGWFLVAVLFVSCGGAGCGRSGEPERIAVAEIRREDTRACAAAAEAFRRAWALSITPESHYSPTFTRCFLLHQSVVGSPDQTWDRVQTLWDAQQNRLLATVRGPGRNDESPAGCNVAEWKTADCSAATAYIEERMRR